MPGQLPLRYLTSVEICAGAGGQALGLERAGFDHKALVEIDAHACRTLRANRPDWPVIEGDVRDFDGTLYRGVDLLAGGVPCPPFSVAGAQLGQDDERDLFPEALRLVGEIQPRAILLENVRGLLSDRFEGYRAEIEAELARLGYWSDWQLLQASSFGVPQLRPRALLVALHTSENRPFEWPTPLPGEPPTVGNALYDLMAGDGWVGADAWRERAQSVGPTLVGGSKKHGGPDLGPTRAKRAWAALGVNGKLIGNAPPGPNVPPDADPYLTVRMAARIQGFPDSWAFIGRKTNAYRQVGNAFPPPVAHAVGAQIAAALSPASVLPETLVRDAA